MSAKHYSFENKKFAIYILGAGFSYAAGLPLASELWKEVRRRVHLEEWSARHFDGDLDYYIQFKNECDGTDLTPDTVDFEYFLGFLDVEFHLSLRGSDTWSSDGNETQVLIKTLIAQILTEHMPKYVPSLYLQFAEKLRPNDHILTFNYDTLLERALDAAGVPYRLFPDRYKTVHDDGGAIIDDSREEVIILKLHGSIDWFDRRKYRKTEEDYLRQGHSFKPQSRVFNPPDALKTIPLVDGIRHDDDPLGEVHRVENIQALYRNPPFLLETPLLIPPSTAKILYSRKFGDFWRGLGQAGGLNLSMAVIGFSLALHDEYARQVMFYMVRNYQNVEWGTEIFGRRKEPVLMIDFRVTDKEQENYRKRYAFVDWQKADTYFGGFNEEALLKL